eukprot:gene23865-9426_t
MQIVAGPVTLSSPSAAARIAQAQVDALLVHRACAPCDSAAVVSEWRADSVEAEEAHEMDAVLEATGDSQGCLSLEHCERNEFQRDVEDVGGMRAAADRASINISLQVHRDLVLEA